MTTADPHPPDEHEILDPEVDAVDLMPELSGHAWLAALKRTVAEFKDDHLLDWAAALTFFGLLSLFPALLVMVALLGLFGQYPQTVDSMAEILRGAGVTRETVESIRSPVDDVVRSTGGAGALLGLGLVGAIWSASGYVGAFRRASNAVYEIDEGRPYWKLRPLQIALTVAAVLTISLIAFSIALTGGLAASAGRVLGVGDATVTAWNVVKWPVLLVIASLIIAVLYWATPNVKQQFHVISPGSVAALLIWIVATLGFSLYLSTLGSYSRTYGTLGGLIALLVWMWLSNMALLFGAELNSEVERSRQLRAGLPAQDQLQLEPRAAPRPGAVERLRDTSA
jgi:membrane protein